MPFQLWLKFRPSPLENAVMKNKRPWSVAQQKCRQSDCEWTMISNLCVASLLNFVWMVDMFVGPDFSGHHFIASDAHDAWESKKSVTPKPLAKTLQKFDFKTCKAHVKQRTGIYAVSNYANLRGNLGTCFLACTYFFWKVLFEFLVASSWTANNLLQQQAVTGLTKPL